GRSLTLRDSLAVQLLAYPTDRTATATHLPNRFARTPICARFRFVCSRAFGPFARPARRFASRSAQYERKRTPPPIRNNQITDQPAISPETRMRARDTYPPKQ
ncbi:MAG TPA: hypothetical protein VFJ06_10665, partial [Halococcus sp.]|nr:hypothetical protein [Halococcus sp.]